MPSFLVKYEQVSYYQVAVDAADFEAAEQAANNLMQRNGCQAFFVATDKVALDQVEEIQP